MKSPQLIYCLIALSLLSCKRENKTPETEKETQDPTAYIDEKPDPIYAEHVRTSAFQTPAEELNKFTLPPGFEITLFASEPEITKPINMAFDAKGRLWVTQSSEYPIKAGPGNGTDRISILEDTDQDGKADKITDFANDLNIPIGIQPIKGGAIGFSIPNIYRFYDTNGDDVADKREIILGPFETKDTHGMVNNLFRGLDGWIHASHGFSNVSTVTGKDGNSITMTSGNTFRFTMDGQHVEKTSDGRINPFGSDLDKWGYHYSADCHTLPIYQIIRNGNYTQWGKMEPNMGHAPTMMDYGLNSTALSGLVYYTDNQFPEEYQNSFYSGDVVTCRISRSTISFNGSTPKASRKADFLVSKDPWFRPVDIKIGPDGAMYIADFYNSIIGHYEVPLDHPERDRNSGRIWKITYKGSKKSTIDWSTVDLDFLLEKLADPILQTRMMATDELVDRFPIPAIPVLKNLTINKEMPDIQNVQVLWALFRLNELTDQTLENALTSEKELVRVHAFRILGEYQNLNRQEFQWIEHGLSDESAHVRRVAAEGLIRHHSKTMVVPILQTLQKTKEEDSHLMYALKYALFQHAQNPGILTEMAAKNWSGFEKEMVALIFSDTRSVEAGKFLMEYLRNTSISEEKFLSYLTAITRSLPAAETAGIIELAKGKMPNIPAFKKAMALNNGTIQKGSNFPNPLKTWNIQISQAIFKTFTSNKSTPKEQELEALKYAVQLSGQLKNKENIPAIKALINNFETKTDLRELGVNALIEIDPASQIGFLEKWLRDANSSIGFRKKIAEAIGKSTSDHALTALGNGLKNTPMELQEHISAQLSISGKGKNQLLKLIQEGYAPARVLKARQVEERFLTGANEKQKLAYEQLTMNLPPISSEKQALIEQRTEAFQSNPEHLVAGKTLFKENCGICHRVGDEGGMIGPQLDGVGNWGVQALATKVLDPNRNISENFRTYTIHLKDGQTKSGLFRREDEQVLVMADQSGTEFTIFKKDIEKQAPSNLTLMPDHFGTTLDQSQFNGLMTYLLNLR
ncbi:PVC-type heme-binding CxxCH protein [Cyclobacterium marinum]|uniref:PVC-type heme-binding CxxCH protein n=1 Tax=Cyclobacterium marinum TaxID=104 RepID=UPI0011EE0F8A|nr:PVC-type heme-binding CxxCH protein [Cyclobacterium marinum]MBI0400506.1 c-type cytochrome [Cyclobacterium marinum]